MYGQFSRIGVWAASAVLAGGTAGLGWTTQAVEINVIWLLVLTFVPTSDLINVVQTQLDKVGSREVAK